MYKRQYHSSKSRLVVSIYFERVSWTIGWIARISITTMNECTGQQERVPIAITQALGLGQPAPPPVDLLLTMETPWVRSSCFFVPRFLFFLFSPASRYVCVLRVPSSVQQSSATLSKYDSYVFYSICVFFLLVSFVSFLISEFSHQLRLRLHKKKRQNKLWTALECTPSRAITI